MKKFKPTQRVALTKELNAKLIKQAKKESRTISNLIFVALEKYLSN